MVTFLCSRLCYNALLTAALKITYFKTIASWFSLHLKHVHYKYVVSHCVHTSILAWFGSVRYGTKMCYVHITRSRTQKLGSYKAHI